MLKKNVRLLIAIDGYASSGKGTLAKLLAKEFNLMRLDTGLLYRKLGYLAKQQNLIIDDKLINEDKVVSLIKDMKIIENEEEMLRGEKIATLASIVANNKSIRESLIEFQRKFAFNKEFPNGTILDGRDIATVICPEANVKFFITAQQQIRAKRRYKELRQKGEIEEYNLVLESIIKRDISDKNREYGALKRDPDAILIDTSHKSINEVLNDAISIVTKITDI